MHGYGDNALGTLSFASRNDTVPGADYARCAELLIAAGMPTTFDKEYTFSDEVTMVLESHRGLGQVAGESRLGSSADLFNCYSAPCGISGSHKCCI